MSKQSFVILSTTEGRVYLTHTATAMALSLFCNAIQLSFFKLVVFCNGLQGNGCSPINVTNSVTLKNLMDPDAPTTLISVICTSRLHTM
jgi:hypothetical protein